MHKATRWRVVRCVLNVLVWFFWPQMQARFFGRFRPVVSVDHPLDSEIPFDARYAPLYLSFIDLWMNAAYAPLRITRRGTARERLIGRRYAADFVDGISDLYVRAGHIYTNTQSTTIRPAADDWHARFIRFFDPHLHCVPSLHVWAVVYSWAKTRELVRSVPELSGLADSVDYLRGQAVAITDSILFMKQHSLNCIYTSLHTMTKIYPEFTTEDADAFCLDLLQDPAIDRRDDMRQVIIDGLAAIRKRDADLGNPDAKELILDFLGSYCHQTGSTR